MKFVYEIKSDVQAEELKEDVGYDSVMLYDLCIFGWTKTGQKLLI